MARPGIGPRAPDLRVRRPTDVAGQFVLKFAISGKGGIISIFHVCMVWIEKSVTRVTDRHHEACRVMPNSDPE